MNSEVLPRTRAARKPFEVRRAEIVRKAASFFAQFGFDYAADQRVIGERFDSLADRAGRGRCGARIVRGNKFESTRKIIERGLCIDYLRHGRGRGDFGLVARRSSHACTSSAR